MRSVKQILSLKFESEVLSSDLKHDKPFRQISNNTLPYCYPVNFALLMMEVCTSSKEVPRLSICIDFSVLLLKYTGILGGSRFIHLQE